MGYAMYFVKAGLLSIGGSYLESNYFPNFFPGMVESSTALAGNAMKRYSHPLAKEVWTLLLSQIILMGLVGFKIGGFFNYW